MANGYTNLDVCNLSYNNTTDKSKYAIVKSGSVKKFNIPKKAPEYQCIYTDGKKVEYICEKTLEKKA